MYTRASSLNFHKGARFDKPKSDNYSDIPLNICNKSCPLHCVFKENPHSRKWVRERINNLIDELDKISPDTEFTSDQLPYLSTLKQKSYEDVKTIVLTFWHLFSQSEANTLRENKAIMENKVAGIYHTQLNIPSIEKLYLDLNTNKDEVKALGLQAQFGDDNYKKYKLIKISADIIDVILKLIILQRPELLKQHLSELVYEKSEIGKIAKQIVALSSGNNLFAENEKNIKSYDTPDESHTI